MKRFVYGCAVALAISSGTAALSADAEALWTKSCTSCHGKDGKGKTPAGRKIGAKDLTVSKIPDEEIRRQIREGRKDPKGKALMPSFKDGLSEEDINSLADYVRKLRK